MNFDLEKPFSLSTAPATFKFLEEELLCTSETNFIIIFNLLKFFSVTRQSYVLKINIKYFSFNVTSFRSQNVKMKRWCN